MLDFTEFELKAENVKVIGFSASTLTVSAKFFTTQVTKTVSLNVIHNNRHFETSFFFKDINFCNNDVLMNKNQINTIIDVMTAAIIKHC